MTEQSKCINDSTLYPPCPNCGALWIAGGGMYGAGVQQWFKCECGAAAVYLSSSGGATFLAAAPEAAKEPLNNYINHVVFPYLQMVGADVEAAWESYVAGRFPKVKTDEDRERYTEEHREFLIGRRSPQLPCIPKGITGYAPRTGEGWVRMDPEESAKRPRAHDVRRAGHEAYFSRIFDAVRTATGTAFIPERIANRYYDDIRSSEPWFAFDVHETAFIVGPRKRVVHIEAAGLPSGTSPISRLGKRDDVTYEESEGSAMIHAWTEEKAIEYLTLLVKHASRDA